eukprot:1127415_1
MAFKNEIEPVCGILQSAIHRKNRNNTRENTCMRDRHELACILQIQLLKTRSNHTQNGSTQNTHKNSSISRLRMEQLMCKDGRDCDQLTLKSWRLHGIRCYFTFSDSNYVNRAFHPIQIKAKNIRHRRRKICSIIEGENHSPNTQNDTQLAKHVQKQQQSAPKQSKKKNKHKKK